MQRAGQTPHGARPNREGARNFGFAHAPARRVKPPGRSLEPGSDAGPRGMAVPPERSGGQNSAYRSGCHKLLLSITAKANKARCDAGVTRLLGQRQRAFGNWNARQLFGRNNPLITSSERHNPGTTSRQARYRDQSRKRSQLLYCPSSILEAVLDKRLSRVTAKVGLLGDG
jgi:hypothetical protein